MIELKWMNKTALVLSMGCILASQAYAQDNETIEVPQTVESVDAQESVSETSSVEAETSSSEISDTVVAESTDNEQQPEPVSVDTTPVASESSAPTQISDETATTSMTASEALQQQEGDATQKENLEEVFTASERQYSLLKSGQVSLNYDFDYSYYRDTQLDLALDDSTSSLTRLRIEDNASHNITNTFTLQYGLLDNLTLTASLPLVAKSDDVKDTTTAGLGDISVGARWEPFPLKQGRLPLILFGSLSTKTGDSPYEINSEKDLSTGKGYYSVGGGASTRKYIDPVVLFASVSANYGFEESDLNQRRGSRVLDSFEPGVSGGFSFGFAYSFNYDVSMTMSYQQSFNTGSKFTFTSGETSKPADQSSASLGISLGVRVSPQTIVNGTVGIGLTEDAPDVSLGLSFPIDFFGFGRDVR